MVQELGATSDGGIPLDVSQSAPRYARYKRKKSAWAVWLQVCAITGVVGALAGVAWGLISRDANSLTIPPIADLL